MGPVMIKLTRLNKSQIVVNSDLIETIEDTPDTVITLTTGEKIVVREGIDEVIAMVVSFKQRIYSGIDRNERQRGRRRNTLAKSFEPRAASDD